MTNLERLANALELAARSADAADRDHEDAIRALNVAAANADRSRKALYVARHALENYIEGVSTQEGASE